MRSPALAALLLAACAPAAPEPAAPLPAPSAAPSPAPQASSAQVASASAAPPAPPPAPCSEALLALPFGKTLEPRSDELKSAPKSERGALTELLPSVRDQGFLVDSATAIQIGADATARALVLTRPLEEGQSPLGPRPTWLGIASCSKDQGYTLKVAPISLGDDSSVLVWGVDRLTLPGGGEVTSLTLAMGGVALEFHAAAFVLGEGTRGLPVSEPKGEKIGVIAIFGNVAEQFLKPGSSDDYARADRAEGTGFFPMGDRELFVSLLAIEGVVTAHLKGWLKADGPKKPGPGPAEDVWLALGKGEVPAPCKDAKSGVRCGKIALPGGGPPLRHDWVMGAWPSAQAAGDALKKLGVDAKKLEFLIVDADASAPLPRGPNGKPALGSIKAPRPAGKRPSRR